MVNSKAIERFKNATHVFRVKDKSFQQFLLEQEQKQGIEGIATKRYKQAKRRKKRD